MKLFWDYWGIWLALGGIAAGIVILRSIKLLHSWYSPVQHQFEEAGSRRVVQLTVTLIWFFLGAIAAVPLLGILKSPNWGGGFTLFFGLPLWCTVFGPSIYVLERQLFAQRENTDDALPKRLRNAVIIVVMAMFIALIVLMRL